MSGREHEEADNLVEMPKPNPPEGGPEADPETPSPADVFPGVGGGSKRRPESADEEE